MSEPPIRRRAARRLPLEVHREAVLNWHDEASRTACLRTISSAALTRGATVVALDATAELISRLDKTNDDYALRARALIANRQFKAALNLLCNQRSSGPIEYVRSLGHLLSGNPVDARTAALAALHCGVTDEDDRRKLDWMIGYLDSLKPSPNRQTFLSRWSGALPEDERVPCLAVLDYRSPDIDGCSTNLGDWIQTVAALRHVARFSGLTWTFDDPGLEAALDILRQTWKPEELIHRQGRLHLAVVDRDYPHLAAARLNGRKAWLIANGWYADKTFGDTRAWPTPSSIEPFLTSVYIQHSSDLTPERVEWLRKRSPIGCRDRSTVRWLRNQGVAAYFSGCLTMTLATLPGPRRGEKLSVDCGEEEGFTSLTHHLPHLRRASFSSNIVEALNVLSRYSAADLIRTSRLHCALPAPAMRAAVHFLPEDAGDRRFDGISNLSDDRFSECANALTSVLSTFIQQVIDGASTSEVRARHQETVSSAWLRTGPAKPTRVVPAGEGAPLDEINVALAFDANIKSHVPALLSSIRASSTADINIIALVRGVTRSEVDALTAAAKPKSVSFFNMDSQLEDVTISLVGHTTLSTMDRLFLPKLAKDFDRVVYLDCDLIVLSDLARLAALDTGQAGIAVRYLPGPHPSNVGQLVEKCARTLDQDKAQALRMLAAETIDLAAPCFNAGVLVLSLDRLRFNRLADAALDLVRRFSLHDQDALILAAAGRARCIPTEWNMIPGVDLLHRPKIVHWAGQMKPWLPGAVEFGSEWREAAEHAKQFKLTPEPVSSKASTAAAMLAPALGPPIDRSHWMRRSSYADDWAKRSELGAKWLPDKGRVADIGCGAPMSLRRYLAKDVTYVPADLKAWTDEVFLIDLDKSQFPPGQFQGAAILGVLEYLQRPGAVLLRASKSCESLVVSYCHPCPGADPSVRTATGWINAFTEQNFGEFLARFGWRITDRVVYDETANMRQLIYRCVRGDRTQAQSLGPLAAAVRAERLTYLRPAKARQA